MKYAAAAILCALWTSGGCSAPARSNPGRATSNAQPALNARSQPLSSTGGANGPVTRIRVQGETVEAAELWLEQRDELEAKSRDLPPTSFRNYVVERSAQLISDKIAEVLLYQRAKLRLPDGADEKVDEFVDAEIRKTVTSDFGGVQRRYEKKLEKQGRSLDAVRDQIRRQIIISSYLDTEVRPRIAEPTRAELFEAFQQNLDAWCKPARRSMSLIDVRIAEFLPGDVTEPTREQFDAARGEARKHVETARSELAAGLPFADAARKYSHALNAADGGAWGFVTVEAVRERFVPAVEALEHLEEEQVSDVIETPDGFFLVRCDRLEPAVEPDFQSVQPLLRDEFVRREYNRKIAELVFELRQSARIEPENLEPFHESVVAAAFSLTAANRDPD